MDKKKGKTSIKLDPGLLEIDPSLIYFTFSRIRPLFSCGRPIQQTLDQLLSSELLPADLPQITLLFDGKHYFSLNNRRLFVFKTLRAAGLLTSVVARVKPVPQTKRMKEKYTVEKCSLTAKLMREGAAGAEGNEGNEEMSDMSEDGDVEEKKVEKK